MRNKCVSHMTNQGDSTPRAGDRLLRGVLKNTIFILSGAEKAPSGVRDENSLRSSALYRGAVGQAELGCLPLGADLYTTVQGSSPCLGRCYN